MKFSEFFPILCLTWNRAKTILVLWKQKMWARPDTDRISNNILFANFMEIWSYTARVVLEFFKGYFILLRFDEKYNHFGGNYHLHVILSKRLASQRMRFFSIFISRKTFTSKRTQKTCFYIENMDKHIYIMSFITYKQ